MPPAGVVLTEGSLRALRTYPGRQNAPRGPDTLARAMRPEPSTEKQGKRGRLGLYLIEAHRPGVTC